ncbi:MAG: glycosyltransferase [Candidatus Aminicenantes bacterium]|nr:glycosyltransferase [Candidatus Aminicenantes bacterium]
MISVIIPTYNRASFLAEAIQSVLSQDYFVRNSSSSFELLVIDDGSTDNTKEVVNSFGKKMKYHFQEHKGVSAARNLGLDLAQGEYIAFLDSDDLWKKEKISIQMSFMNAFPQAKVCYTEEIWMRRGVFVNPKKKHRKYSGWIFDRVLPLCLISLSSALFRREVFEVTGKFDEELLACEDYDFGIRLALKCPVYFLPKPLIIKRGGHSDQLSRKYWGMDRFRVKALEKTLRLDLTPHQEILVKREIVRKCQILASGFEKRKNKPAARKYLSLIDKYRLTEQGQKMEEK